MSGVLIMVPCRRFRVGVRLGSTEGLGHIEQFVLRTIAVGQDTLTAVREILHLPERVVLDSCMDLLRRGHLTIDRQTGQLEVAPGVRSVMGDPLAPDEGWAARLAPGQAPEGQEIDLLQDLVGGAVFPISQGSLRLRSALLAPENDQLPAVSEVPKAMLLHAVARVLRRKVENDKNDLRAGSSSKLKVLDVVVAGNGSAPGEVVSTPMRMNVEVCARRPWLDDDEPQLSVVGPPGISRTVRQGIARGLVELWRRGVARGPRQFFEDLRERLSSVAPDSNEVPESFETPWEMTRAFKVGVDAIPELPQLREWSVVHQELTDQFVMTRDAIEDWGTRRARAEPIRGAVRHHELLLRSLQEARHQVVLVNPWVKRLSSDEAIRDALVNAVERGVRVHLTWGVDRRHRFEDYFDASAQDLLDLLAPGDQRRGGLFVCHEPAGVHAKVIVCDLAWALVSSSNFLNSGPERAIDELGILIGSPDATVRASEGSLVSPPDERVSAARSVQDALLWTRGLARDYQIAQALSIDPVLDGRREELRPLPIGKDLHAPDGSPVSVALWKEGWHSRAKGLAAFCEPSATYVRLVEDGGHRDLLETALASARRRVVVASPDLGVGIFGTAIAPLLLQARLRGVEITLVYRESKALDGDLMAWRKQAVEAGVRLLQTPTHVKALVCDDWAVITSFNFLSYEGYYSGEKVARRELGAFVASEAFASTIVSLLTTVTC